MLVIDGSNWEMQDHQRRSLSLEQDMARDTSVKSGNVAVQPRGREVERKQDGKAPMWQSRSGVWHLPRCMSEKIVDGPASSVRVLLRARRRGRFLPRQLRETSFSHLPTSAVPAGTPSFVVFRMF
ncbi:hypothetical protein D6D01_04898 [Aureobasidium pullulans]|uniref:Uncharacterized protein n=1 Tax=Aureobasidium pullulans TaxID=5580 RepID=A0A4S9L956_AURPU|nr:hypothetical protein D6D01_04898 [Aureobasidium pullulans]